MDPDSVGILDHTFLKPDFFTGSVDIDQTCTGTVPVASFFKRIFRQFFVSIIIALFVRIGVEKVFFTVLM